MTIRGHQIKRIDPRSKPRWRDMNYVLKKIRHMERFGIIAKIGKHGGARPAWMDGE